MTFRSRFPSEFRQTSKRPRRRLRVLFGLLALALVAAGCSSGPGSQQELEEILTTGGSISESDASCIADSVFEEYSEDDDALSAISAAPDFEFLSSEEGVPGFAEFFDSAVRDCTAFGPVSG